MRYPSDLSDEQWDLVKGFFSKKDSRGRKPKHDRRSIVNAIWYVATRRIQWKMLPKDFPHYKTVHEYFMTWHRAGLWNSISALLTEEIQKKEEQQSEFTDGIIDPQSIENLYPNEK